MPRILHQEIDAAVNDDEAALVVVSSLRLDSGDNDNNNTMEMDVKKQQQSDTKAQLIDGNETIATAEDESSSSWRSSTSTVEGQRQRQRRCVQLADSSSNVIIPDTMEPWSEEELQASFTQPDDAKRVDMDLKATIQQWADYKRGNIPHFNEDEFTMRGLEEALDHLRCSRSKNNVYAQPIRVSRHELKTMHTNGVLEEVERQKKRRNVSSSSSNRQFFYDAEELRRVSERLSESARQQAIRTADTDQLAVRNVLHMEWRCYSQTEDKQQQQQENMTSFRRQSEPAPKWKKAAAATSGGVVVDTKKRRKSMFSFIKIKKN